MTTEGVTSAEGNLDVSKANNSSELLNRNTVFVGNVPLSVTRRQLRRLCGDAAVESVRLRGVPCSQLTNPSGSSLKPRRVAVITRQFVDGRTSMSAYIRLGSAADMERVVARLNGLLLLGHHLRCNRAAEAASNVSARSSVFVGGLPVEMEEEALREHFSACGDMLSVRLVRDPTTGQGRGFGFVNFSDESCVEAALKLAGSTILERQIRVQKCSAKSPNERKPRHPKADNKTDRDVVRFTGEQVADGLSLSLANGKNKKKKKPRWNAAARESRNKRKTLTSVLPGCQDLTETISPVEGSHRTVGKKIIFNFTEEKVEDVSDVSSRQDRLIKVREAKKAKVKKAKQKKVKGAEKSKLKRASLLASTLPKM